MTANATEVQKDEAGSSPLPMAPGKHLGNSRCFIKPRCGSCLHLNRIPHAAYKRVCATWNVTPESQPCVRYTPDPTKINIKDSEHLQALALVLEGIPTADLPILAALINGEAQTRARRFTYGQIVYLRVFGGDYISNYRRCRVISADRNFVHVEATEGWVGSVHHKSVLRVREWQRKRAELSAAKKIRDPNFARYFRKPSKAEQEMRKFLENKEPLALDRASLDRDIFVASEGPKKRQDARRTDVTELLKVR